jgi:hypothetical protein
VSCCMRDAASFEAAGIPTVILVNDVFRAIAGATASILHLPAEYVAQHVIWLPHPTSNLTQVEVAALIDERLDAIRAALLNSPRTS